MISVSFQIVISLFPSTQKILYDSFGISFAFHSVKAEFNCWNYIIYYLGRNCPSSASRNADLVLFFQDSGPVFSRWTNSWRFISPILEPVSPGRVMNTQHHGHFLLVRPWLDRVTTVSLKRLFSGILGSLRKNCTEMKPKLHFLRSFMKHYSGKFFIIVLGIN